LQAQLHDLSRLQAQLPAGPSATGSSSPPAARKPEVKADSTWAAKLHAAKKKRVYVARKLRYIDAILDSMQPALKFKLAQNPPRSPARRQALERTLRELQQVRSRWLVYDNDYQKLS
jgi:hypothetical protein